MSSDLRPVRRDWLNDIVNDLSGEEWRELHAILSQRSFQLDIVGNLPVELVAIICAHLDIIDAYRCLFVSRTWHDLILQPIVQEAFLKQWYTASDPPLIGEQFLDEDDLFQLRIEHATRFKRATPYTTAVQSFRNDNAERFIGVNSQLTQSHYADGVLVYTMIDPSKQPSLRRDDILQVHDLRNGKVKKIKTPARETILTLTTTRNLIGYITFSGICYAHSKETGVKSWINLPSATIHAFSGRDSHLCIVIEWTIVVWDVEHHIVKSFHVPAVVQSPSAPRVELVRETISDEQIHLSPDKTSVVYFVLSSLSLTEGHSSTHPWDILYACRFSLSGELISTDAIETRSRWLLDHPRSTYCALGARSCGRAGLFAICFTSVPLESDDNDGIEPSLSIIVFDENTDRLLEYKTVSVLGSSKVAVWKGICISAGESHISFLNEDGKQYDLKRSTHIGEAPNQAAWINQVFVDDFATVTFSTVERRSGNWWEFNALVFDKNAQEGEET